MNESTASKRAKKLAQRHIAEIIEGKFETEDEIKNINEMLKLEFVAQRNSMGELEKQEFTLVYNSLLYPNSLEDNTTNCSKKQSPSDNNQNKSSLCCKKCGSSHLSADKAGFSLGKALIGGFMLGGTGLLSGFIGSRKISITCLKCGHTWKAGEK